MKAKVITISLIALFISFSASAQQGTNKAKLQELSQRFDQRHNQRRAEAIQFAATRGIPMRQTLADGTLIELQFIENGRPVFYETHNIKAAQSVRVDELWLGGSLGLNLDGSGFTGLGLWDGGAVRTSHDEFTNNGPSRVLQQDFPSSTHYHATHVAGTLVAGGVQNAAKGMAFNSTLKAWDWDNDESEMAGAAANSGVEISNHSYGFAHGWSGTSWTGDISISDQEDYWFGFYTNYTRDWDQIAYNAPDYLIVKSAGNDRNDDGPGIYPPDGNAGTGYDCIGTKASAKNILTVGAVEDVLNYTGPSSVTMSYFSSWGPVDDGRIKPDIVANGIGLYSTYDNSDQAYNSISGTSMSSPNAAGAMALLKEHYQNTHGGAHMRASTLKALVIHTADECGPDPGPDYMFGWGLLNAKAAAEKITEDDDNFLNVIEELDLSNGQTITMPVNVDVPQDLWVTICWTDIPGTPVSASLDPIDPMLVNDLDLRITGNSTTYFPYKLERDNPEAAATNNGENNVDNVEMVYIPNAPAGTYDIIVDHDGNIGGGQFFSMIISGISSAAPPEPPVADFVGIPTTLEEGQSVTFTDQSLNNPTSWSWTFEGGTPSSSNAQNPVVSYNTAGGPYDVTLVVTNAVGADSKTITNYITVNPFVEEYCDSHGDATAEWISSVSLGGDTKTSSSSGTAGYMDLTAEVFTLSASSDVPITMIPGFNPRNKFEYWAVWIDLNQSTSFEAGELVFTDTKKRAEVSGTIDLSGLPDGFQTRMRISMSRGGVQGSCDIFDSGEVKDYTIEIGQGTPVEFIADFEANLTNITLGQTVQFTDLTTGNPNTWTWTFEGGNPTGSAIQNPSVTYNSNGVYNVTLSASNGTDSDVITKLNYITVSDVPPPDYCSSQASKFNQDWIAGVTLNSVSNTSGGSGYTYFDNTGMTLNEGLNTIELTPGFLRKTQNEFWKIWIDLNGDMSFDGPGEEVFSASGSDIISTSFNVDDQFVSGVTRMRVSMSRDVFPTACGSIDRGEVEDYLINLDGSLVDGGKSGMLQIGASSEVPELSIYPNPSDNILNISYSGELKSADLRIYNIQGSVVRNLKLNSNHTVLDIADLTKGVYYVALSTESKIIYKKMVKQ